MNMINSCLDAFYPILFALSRGFLCSLEAAIPPLNISTPVFQFSVYIQCAFIGRNHVAFTEPDTEMSRLSRQVVIL